MIPYVIAYLLMIAAAVILQRKKNGKKLYIIFFALLWIVILGLRHPSMGIDLGYDRSYGYLQAYRELGEYSFTEMLTRPYMNFERGYIVLNKILYTICTNYRLLLIVCALIPMISISVWIYKNSAHPFLASLIYLGLPCFVINFSTLRQVIALSITLWAFEYIKKRKPIPFFAVVLLAVFFHKSAIVFLAAYPIYWFKTKRSLQVVSLAIPIAIFLLKYQIFMFLMRLTGGDKEPDYNGAKTLFIVLYLVYVYTVVFAKQKTALENGARNLFFVSVALQAMGGVYSGVLRVGYYFIIYAVLLLPEIVENHRIAKNNDARINYVGMYVIIALCFGFHGFYLLQNSSWAMAVPYRFFI